MRRYPRLMDEGEPVDDAVVAEPVRGRGVRGIAIVAVLAAFAAGGTRYAGSRDGEPPAPPAPRAVRETGAAGSSSVVVPGYSYTPPPSWWPPDPFTGTSVASWPVGIEGVKAPEGRALGSYSDAQVAHAYARTAAYLRVAMLDEKVLWEGDLNPVYDRLRPDSVRVWTSKHGAASLANRFPSTVRSRWPGTRVNGEMSAHLSERGALRIDFTYVVVYLVERTEGGPADFVAIRRGGMFEYFALTPATVTVPWVRLAYYVSDHGRCENKKFTDYLDVQLRSWRDRTMPPGPPSPGATPAVPLPTLDILDPRASLPPMGTCVANTGTF